MTIQQEIETIIHTIKRSPMDLNPRLKLVQLYILEGSWEQALRTIQGYLKLNPKDEQSKKLLQANIECEIKRLDVFTQQQKALAYPASNQTIVDLQQDLLVACLSSAEQNAVDKFLQLVDIQATEQQITCYPQDTTDSSVATGTWLDTDMRTASVIELFFQSEYYWLPISDIKQVTFKPSEVLTDMVWRRADIQLMNGQATAGFIPTRYIMTKKGDYSDALKHAKLTQWQEQNGVTLAQGQKVLSNGDKDVSILDIDKIIHITS